MATTRCQHQGVYLLRDVPGIPTHPQKGHGALDTHLQKGHGTRDTPPCEQIYASENITFPHLRRRAVIKSLCCVLGDADALEITLKSKGKKGDNFNIPVQNEIV